MPESVSTSSLSPPTDRSKLASAHPHTIPQSDGVKGSGTPKRGVTKLGWKDHTASAHRRKAPSPHALHINRKISGRRAGHSGGYAGLSVKGAVPYLRRPSASGLRDPIAGTTRAKDRQGNDTSAAKPLGLSPTAHTDNGQR